MLEQRERSSAATISTSAVQLLHEYTGRGPTNAKTEINDDLVTIVLANTLTKGESKLVESGKSDEVLRLRHFVEYGSMNRYSPLISSSASGNSGE